MAGNGSAVNRRRFLFASGAAMAGSGAAWGLIPGQRQGGVPLPGPSAGANTRPTQSATPAAQRPAPYGATTLETAARLGGSGGSGYRRLVSGAAGADDAHILVFSHHNSPTMTRRPDAARSDEPRHDGQELIALLSRFPNVVAWINGHSHINRITPHAHMTAARSFWEVNTASHVDYPHHARVIELVDNHDGTLSLLTTLIESAAPHRTNFDDLSATGLASLYRELAYNSPGLASGMTGGVNEGWAGAASDRNTELLVQGV